MKQVLLLGYVIFSCSCFSQLPFLVKDIYTGSVNSAPRQFTAFGGKTYFSVFMGSAYDELWVTDGTTVGTHAVKDANNATVLNPTLFLGEFNGKLYFSATDGVNGTEIWTTDGTSSGTYMLKDINPSGDSAPRYFIAAGNYFYFTAYDNINGREWWISDGTTTGTNFTTNVNTDTPTGSEINTTFIATPLGNSVVFSHNAGSGSVGFRRDVFIVNSNLTYANLTAHLNAVSNPGLNGTKLITYNNAVYFNFDEDNEGNELFKTDGTIAGTQRLNFLPGSLSFEPDNFFLFKNKLCFSGYPTGTGSRAKLYISDGTLAGSVNLGVEVVNLTSSSNSLYAINNDTIYFAGTTSDNDMELWKSDGTVSGTYIVKDIHPSSGSSPNNLTWYNGKLYFTAVSDTNLSQPWVSDGTAQGTVMLKNIWHSASDNLGSYAKNFTGLNGKIYFTARIDKNDFQLFESDGTESGTRAIYPTDVSNTSNPLGTPGVTVTPASGLNLTNGMILFSANYHNLGKELYRIGGQNLSAISSGGNTNRQVLVFPNPGNNFISIQTESQLQGSAYTIVNQFQQTVLTGTLYNQTNIVDISGLAAGLYFLQIKEAIPHSYKLIKQ